MKGMVCVPEKIRVGLPEEDYNNSILDLSITTVRKHHRVDCDICGEQLWAISLQKHLESQHKVYRSFVLSRDLETSNRPEEIYRASAISMDDRHFCPIPNCVGTDGMQEVESPAVFFNAPPQRPGHYS